MANKPSERGDTGKRSGSPDSQSQPHHVEHVEASPPPRTDFEKFSAPEGTIVVTPSPEPNPQRGSSGEEGNTDRGSKDG